MLSDCEGSDDDTFGDSEDGQGKNAGGSSEPGKKAEPEPEVESVNNLTNDHIKEFNEKPIDNDDMNSLRGPDMKVNLKHLNLMKIQ